MYGISTTPNRSTAGRLPRATAPPPTDPRHSAAASHDALAAMSHELRTPLNIVVNLIDLLQQTRPTPEQHEYLELLKIAGSSLLAAVNGVLEFARIDAGQYEIEVHPFPLRALLRDTLRLLAVKASAKGLALRGEIAPEVPDTLLGDPLRLRQILVNLIGNAIKFTEHGEITVRVALQAGTGDDVSCRFSVSDQGIGIAPEQQAAIFAPYRRIEGGSARPVDGCGLGLAISARLVEMMNGNIWVDSAPGQGSTFHFTACFGYDAAAADTPPEPAPLSAPAPHFAPAPGAARRPTILLVEDNPTNRRLTGIVLEKAGYRVLLAASAAAACACLERERLDAVLMDVQLPDGDGFQATAAIRRREAAHGGHVPIIALTARTLSGDSARCLHAGMDAYLAKPVEPASLLAILHHITSQQTATGRPRRPAVVDRRTLLGRVDGDRRLLREVRDLFLRDCARLLARVRSLAGRDDERLAAALHTLRGMCQSLAAPAAIAAVCALEDSPPGSRQFAGRLARLEFEIRRLRLDLLVLAGAGRRLRYHLARRGTADGEGAPG
ncbi:ATP-binding protein [Dechloromonas sp. XY25]|uniref:histidine kinase n=1 Tax=Dechloromonas hankyongensis TaxID=2908002 RepID=A0ABS9K660_9RHOO|nr:ATP-binding protein [Dechloromonas hankyongensis]MCG2578653.1 ATP-binding protein [Dechloromonas hankyongensis]